jgi:hypothetical protein
VGSASIHRLSDRQAMDMNVRFVAAVDKAPVCRRLLAKSLPHGCIFRCLDIYIKLRDICDRHGVACSMPSESPDLVSVGLPCHPFAANRWKSGPTQDTSGEQVHSEFDLVMRQFPAFIASRRPGAQHRIEIHHFWLNLAFVGSLVALGFR